jgi:hypothetical protein
MAALRHRIVKKTLVVLNQELNLQLIISTGAEMCKKNIMFEQSFFDRKNANATFENFYNFMACFLYVSCLCQIPKCFVFK